MTRRTTLLLVDDHVIVREGIRSLLSGHADLEVVGMTANGATALAEVRSGAPDIVIVDVTLPRAAGFEAVELLHQEVPRMGIIALATHDDEEYVLHALRAGARGYLLKRTPVAELVAAVRAVADGKYHIDPKISHVVVEQFLALSQEPVDTPSLSTRERQVLQLIAEGHRTRAIAARLGVKPKTIETHRQRVMQKLGVRGTAALVRHAVRRGIVSVES